MKTSTVLRLRKLSSAVIAIIAAFSLAAPLPVGSVELISLRDLSTPVADGGNSDSVQPAVSDDGRYVVFNSLANDLVTNDNGQWFVDVFLRDRLSNTTVLVSENWHHSGGGDGHSGPGQSSANGRYVVFESDASDLLANDTNGVSDIFVRDLQTGTTVLVSSDAGSGWANGASTDPMMTPDGRFVVFISAATNLVAADTNGIPDVFVRDLVTSTTTMVSVGARRAGSIMSTPAITPDGRYVVFASTATNLVQNMPLTTKSEVYFRDMLLNETTWVSTNAATTVLSALHLSSMPSYHPRLSDDGRFVSFRSGWTNGVTAPTDPGGVTATVVFRFDTLNKTTTVLSTNGVPLFLKDEDIFGPEMTPDGRFVAFVDRRAAITTNSGVQLWDEQTGTNVLVSIDLTGTWQSNSEAHSPTLSHDGRYVAFLSDATNLVPNVVSSGLHLYRRDLQTATTTLIDVATNGIASIDDEEILPAISGNGRWIVYSSYDPALTASDDNKETDVFLWDGNTGTNELISLHEPLAIPQSGNAYSYLGQLSLSDDAQRVAFGSFASDLVPNDFNRCGDIFVRDTATDTNILVSVGLDGNSGSDGTSFGPLISGDGRFVLFISSATNLVAGNTNNATDVFRRDLQTGTTTLVNVDSSGVSPGAFDVSTSPVWSRDARYVAFICRTNVGTSPTNLFWRDMVSGVTRLVSAVASPGRDVSMSADGQRLAYFGPQSRLYVWDAVMSTNVYTNTAPSLTSAAISPTGLQLVYQTSNQIFLADISNGASASLFPSTVRIKGSGQWSADGRYLVFITATSLLPGDNNGTNDVYMCHLSTGTLTLISVDAAGTTSAAGPSDSPVINADGRFVAFRTFATNVLPVEMHAPSLVVFDRWMGSRTLMATGSGKGGSSWIAAPSLGAHDAVMAFVSWDSGLVSGDFNRAGDAFANQWNAVSFADVDSDGIPDWWMMQFFGHTGGQEGDLSRAQDDADGDGMTTLEEFIAGTNPTNGGSILAVQIDRVGTNGVVSMSWSTISGRNYQVLSTTDLAHPTWVSAGSVTVIGNVGHVNLQSADAQRFFKVVCEN